MRGIQIDAQPNWYDLARISALALLQGAEGGVGCTTTRLSKNPGPGQPPHHTDMQGIKRKIVYITLYELVALAITTAGVVLLSNQDTAHAGIAAVGSSAIAAIWNLIYNTVFERWEADQATRGRSIWRRIAHAFGFELGLSLLLVPLFAWWLEVSLWRAFVLDQGLIIFFLAYTFTFSLIFDRIFGLPASARSVPADTSLA